MTRNYHIVLSFFHALARSSTPRYRSHRLATTDVGVVVVVVINNAHLFRQLIAALSNPFQPLPSPFNAQPALSLSHSFRLSVGSRRETAVVISSSHFAFILFTSAAGEKHYTPSDGRVSDDDETTTTTFPVPVSTVAERSRADDDTSSSHDGVKYVGVM